MLSIHQLVDDERCYEIVRAERWPDGVRCPACESASVRKRGHHATQKARQRYQCKACNRQFDDLTDTVFAGHHQSLKVWVICLYLMGLNLSNQQIARELGLNKADVQAMTEQLREGVVAKKAS
jgi:transposase-like protein